MTEESNTVSPPLEGCDMTNVVLFDPDFRKDSTTSQQQEDSISSNDPITFARNVSSETGLPYSEVLIDLYNAVVGALEEMEDNPELFLDMLADADVIKEELIREGVL